MTESGVTFDCAQLVMDDEWAAMIKQVIGGVRVDAEMLMLDDIKSVGPFGDFLSLESTYRFMRAQSNPTRRRPPRARGMGGRRRHGRLRARSRQGAGDPRDAQARAPRPRHRQAAESHRRTRRPRARGGVGGCLTMSGESLRLSPRFFVGDDAYRGGLAVLTTRRRVVVSCAQLCCVVPLSSGPFVLTRAQRCCAVVLRLVGNASAGQARAWSFRG